ncbi:GNAT family N-acetyltransferase [Stenotrophomonas maltophilia]|uniref:GNAT family N-acetyltransferase n=2 Tax=Stenotrophomonas maltophilia TaxID=40324 RepID=UPI0018610F0D|nr:GNAT family protein [Stenotrophomonas maltophilia]MCU1133540.1 GNAT family N-acetyltransferase [Stenotrophomonas maltophilia]QNA96099.1 GNAT family N-acetyltransferase [Stenotrophomonas maltophilia]HDS1549056.1 GNAT family N-acetyltransferase [Stenotrophomonas maltophilia]
MVWRFSDTHRAWMTNRATYTHFAPLRPVLRRHLLHLQATPITLRSFQRTDLPRWRTFDDRRQRGQRPSYGIDEEARFLASVHRSRLQEDNDLLVLGVFDDAQGILHDQLHVRLQSLHSRCAELQSLQHRNAHPQATLRALCPFLFDNVGLHRIFVLLPPGCTTPFAQALQAHGFMREGILRDYHLDAEGWHDRQLLALTAPAWRSNLQRIG